MQARRLHDRLPALLNLLYAAPGSREGWHAFLLDLCRAFDGTAASFLSHNLSAQEASITLTARTDPQAVEGYVAYWGAQDPWASSEWEKLTPGSVITGEALVSRRDLQRTAFYNDFAKRYDIGQCVAGLIEKAPNQLSFLAIDAADSHLTFGSEEVRLLQALMPHLQRALQVHRRLLHADALVETSQTILDRLSHGVILLDATGRPTLANLAAQAIFRSHDGLSIDGGELRAASIRDTTALRESIASATRTSQGRGIGAGGTLTLGRPSGRRPLSVVVAPISRSQPVLGPASVSAVVFVKDPERVPLPSEEDIRTNLGLTPAEARLARALAEGLDLASAAGRLGVGVGTLRTRLKSVFEKTGCHRQAELVRLILLGG